MPPKAPAAPTSVPPALIREPLYAPPCPPPAAALFDAALVLQNEGKFGSAINATLKAQQAWEQSLLEEHYPDIEDKVAHSILLRLRQTEQREIEAAEAAKALREAEDENGEYNSAALSGSDDDDEAELERQMASLVGETDEAAEKRVRSNRGSVAGAKRVSSVNGKSKSDSNAPASSSKKEGAHNSKKHNATGASSDPHSPNSPSDPNAIFLKQQQAKLNAILEEAAQRKAEEESAAKKAFDEERERKRQEKIDALHHVYQLVPLEGKIFLQLRLSSIYESAGDDERALACALYALRYIQTMPVYTESVLTATVYFVLGVIYAHLSQYDYAGDYLFRALEIRETILGEGNVDTATTMHNLGTVLHNLGKPNDALVCYYKSLEVFRRVFPASHPRIETCETNIRKSKDAKFKNLVVPPVPTNLNAGKK